MCIRSFLEYKNINNLHVALKKEYCKDAWLGLITFTYNPLK